MFCFVLLKTVSLKPDRKTARPQAHSDRKCKSIACNYRLICAVLVTVTLKGLHRLPTNLTKTKHEIYSFDRGGFAPNMQQISSQYLLWFKNYNHLNLKVQFSK